MIKNSSFLGLLCLLITLLTFHSEAQSPNTWTQKSNFGGPERFGAISFSIGTKGYTGVGYKSNYLKDFWEYDPLTDSWSQKADFGGTGRAFAAGFSIGTKGYVGTGLDITTRTKDFWEYDAVTNTWSQKADFGGSDRSNAISFSIDSKGYIGTGLINSTTRINDFWEYDPANDSWTQKSNVPGPARASAAGFAIAHKGYVGIGNSGTMQKDFWEYNPTTDTWIQKADFAGAARFQAVGISNWAYGYIGLGDIGGGYSNDFWEYDPTLDTWTQKVTFGGEVRTLSTGFSISNKIFVGTGYDFLNAKTYVDFWEYTPSCLPLVISSEPVNQSVTYGSPASFTVSSADALSYQWQEDAGSGFVDITDGGIYSNTTNDTLDISLPTFEMTGNRYRCVITGNCTLTATSDGNATLSVAKMDVIVTPDANQTKEYGSSDPASFTYTYSPPLIGTDALTGGIERVTGEDVGTYSFTSGTISAGNNYSLTIDSSPTFNITALPIVITPDANQTKAYGSADPGSYSFTYSPSLIGTDVITGGIDRVSGEEVGEYVFTSGTLNAGSNYSLTLAISPTFNITPVMLTITADNKEKCYDGAIYSDTYTVNYNGFVNGEDQGVLSGSLIFGGNSSGGTDAGSYSIDPSGLSSTNYALNFVNGTLTIKPTPEAAIISRSGDSLISSLITGNQWYQDGIEIPGSNGSVYVVTSNGSYYTVVSENGCSSVPSNSILVLTVSTEGINSELFEIYPNPGSGIFNIKANITGKQIYDVEIYNNLGSLCWKQTNVTIDANNIKKVEFNGSTSGLYTVVLRNKENSFVKKVLITK